VRRSPRAPQGPRRRSEIDSADRDGGRDDARAVSETVGFVLVFALITTTIAVTFTVGLGGLQDAQTAERDANVERAFDVLHDNLRDVSRDGVPSRATEIRLAGGALVLEEPTEIRFESDEWNTPYVERTRPIVYRGAGDSTVVYENGAVLATDGEESVMLNDPDLLVGDDAYVVSLVRVSGRSRAIAGDRTVLVVGSNAGREVVDRPRSAGAVTMEIETPHPAAWERHYESLAADDPRVDVVDGEGDVTIVFDPDGDDEFIVHQTTISVGFSD